jgi:serine/threonine protein kinase
LRLSRRPAYLPASQPKNAGIPRCGTFSLFANREGRVFSQVNFISEMFASGTLRRYRKRHRHLGDDVMKHWGWQILSGLVYLHGHKPPIVHRDLKCDNIFINGADGVVKIGDLGLATMLHGRTAPQSVIGTPEFMAPELYEEFYDDRVDVYAFGMVMLELATMEYPYSECSNAAQIYRKVTMQVRPAGLQKVACKELADFINTCIAPLEQRPRSRQLLKHPYFASIRNSLHPSKSDLFLAGADHIAGPRSSSAALGRAPMSGGTTNSGGVSSGPGVGSHITRSMSASPAPLGAFHDAAQSQVMIPSELMRELVDMKADEGEIGPTGTESLTPPPSQKSAPCGVWSPARERLASPLGRPSADLARDNTGSGSGSGNGSVTPATGQKRRKGISCRCAATNRCFEFAGKYREDMGKRLLSLRLKILEPDGSSRTIEFEFDMTSDTAMSVASEMVGVLELSPEDAVAISEAMEAEISELLSSLEGQASSDLAQAVGEFQHELSSALQYASSVDVPSGGTVSLSRGNSLEPPPPRVQQRTSSGLADFPGLESMASMHSCGSHKSNAINLGDTNLGDCNHGDANLSDLSTPCRSANRSPLYGSAEDLSGQGSTLIRQGSSDVVSKLHPSIEKNIKAHTPPGGSSRSSFEMRLSPRDGGDNPRESSSIENRSLKKLYESLQQVSDSRESLAASTKPPLPPPKSAGGASIQSALSGQSVQSGLGDMIAGGTGPPSGPPSVGSEKADDAKPMSKDEKLQQAMNALKVVESRSLELLVGGTSNRGVPMKATNSKKDLQLDCAAANGSTAANSSHDSMDALVPAHQSMEDDQPVG